MNSQIFLPVIRELANCYQAFEIYSAQHIRSFGLTPCQFDIIATLGNTDGMSFRELGNKTLITKGTLTGVVDRLAEKNLVRRTADATDGRSQIVGLTILGEELFADIFPRHLQHLDAVFATVDVQELKLMQQTLKRLGGLFNQNKEVV